MEETEKETNPVGFSCEMEWSSGEPLECLEEDRNKGVDVLGSIFCCFDRFAMISVGKANTNAIEERFSLRVSTSRK